MLKKAFTVVLQSLNHFEVSPCCQLDLIITYVPFAILLYGFFDLEAQSSYGSKSANLGGLDVHQEFYVSASFQVFVHLVNLRKKLVKIDLRAFCLK